MEMNKQAELIPSILNAIEGKPLSHQDRFVLIKYIRVNTRIDCVKYRIVIL